jgi:hypothetical protein
MALQLPTNTLLLTDLPENHPEEELLLRFLPHAHDRLFPPLVVPETDSSVLIVFCTEKEAMEAHNHFSLPFGRVSLFQNLYRC